ncbi:MAG: hypothetical protein K6B65_03360 [Bacilli bacterium]|nr:hypothetical protein [Bacilli bacterium]
MRIKKAVALLIPLFLLPSCGESRFLDEPSETNLDFYLTEPFDEEKIKSRGATYLPGWFGASEFLDGRYTPIIETIGGFEQIAAPETKVTYLFCGYPDLSDAPRCVQIYINDPSVFVYGLSLNSAVEEVDGKMKELSFVEEGEGVYVKNGCFFTFSSKEIVMRTPESTNKNNIVY